MNVVYSWIKNLVCFYVFITAVLHLIPQESYQKYVRFFTGLLLVILVVTPVFSLLNDKESLYEKIEQVGFFQEMENLKLDTAYLEESQQRIYQEEYEKAISMDIEQMVQRQDLQTKSVEVRMNGECQIDHIYIEAELLEENNTYPEKAFFSDGEEYPEVYKLQKELEDFYQIEEGQVEIIVKGG